MANESNLSMSVSALRKLFELRLIRFLLVGVLNSLFGFAVFSAIAYFGGQTWEAILGGNVAGILFNFFTIGGVVFRDLALKRLFRFVLAYLGLFTCNLTLIHLMTDAVQVDRITAQAILTVPMAILSYLIMSKFVFVNRRY